MTVKKIVEILDGRVFAGEDSLDREVGSACGADLMSDVMAFVKEDVVLLTGLVHIQTIRTASLMDISAVVFVRGKVPGHELIEEAQKSRIVLISTEYSLFLSCGRLYEAGLRAGSIRDWSTGAS